MILKLYELRREPVLREARAWFFAEFNPTTYEEFGQVMTGEKSAWLRMVISYWDMAASLVTFGAVDQEMFNASNGELLGVFFKVEPFLGQMRQHANAPEYLKHLEQVARQYPGSEALLKGFREQRRAMATAPPEAATPQSKR